MNAYVSMIRAGRGWRVKVVVGGRVRSDAVLPRRPTLAEALAQ